MKISWVHLLEYIGGGVAGAALVLATIILLECWMHRKERRQKQEEALNDRLARLEFKSSNLEFEVTALQSELRELQSLFQELDQAEIPL